jgi:hypothetical protein
LEFNSIQFNIMVVNMNMTIYGLKMYPNMEFIHMKKLRNYISCDVSLLPITLQNAQQHQHNWTRKKKIMLFLYSIIRYLPWVQQKDYIRLNQKKTYLSTKKHLQQQAIKSFYLKKIKTNEKIHSWILKFSHIILMKIHTYFTKGINWWSHKFSWNENYQILKLIHLTYMLFLYGLQIHVTNLF